MISDQEGAARVLALARANDLLAAMAAGKALVEAGKADAGLTLFVGVLSCRSGDLEQGIAHMRCAVAMAPGDAIARTELARALLAQGAFDEIEALSASESESSGPGAREMLRIRAHALRAKQDWERALGYYCKLTAADALDFESWHGMGTSLLGLNEAEAAIEPLREAVRLRPSIANYWSALSRALSFTKDFNAGIEAAQQALARAPTDSAAQIELARALVGLERSEEALAALEVARNGVGDDPALLIDIAGFQLQLKSFGSAEINFRAALAIRADRVPALVGLAKLYERTNRMADLRATIEEADRLGLPVAEMALLRARLLRGEGKLEEALTAARTAPENSDVERAERAQAIGHLAERLGDTTAAFASFLEANRLLATITGDSRAAEQFLVTLDRVNSLLTPGWYARWRRPIEPGARPSPFFIFGFPRSGTTLIDTMLIGHPNTVVLEEEALIQRTSDQLASVDRLADLSPGAIERLRDFYFNEVALLAPDLGRRLLVDKEPLGLINAPMLHRLFPDARYVFMERHPCDVVLSCFIISSRLNMNVAHFFDLASTARVYDRVMNYWERCRTVLPIAVETVRYERLIVDTERELRRVAEFAGLVWDERMLDHEKNAVARSFIGSPSYAQVVEPIYTRSSGRWVRYREQMDTVLPILRPWIEKMGYDPEGADPRSPTG